MQVAYINIFVSSIAGAVAFYQDKLGLRLEYASPEFGYASLSAGSVRLGLAAPDPAQPELVGRHTGVGLAVPDLEAEHARLTALGVVFTMPPTRQPWGGFMALVADPDGNVLYLDQIEAAHA